MMTSARTVARSLSTLAKTMAIAAVFSTAGFATARAAQTPQPTDATPAFMFLDLPATGARSASELPVVSFSYDAEAGVPMRRHDAAMSDDANVRVTMLLAKTDVAIPIAAKTSYVSFAIVETDGAKQTIRRLTFHNVTIESIGPAGDDPSVRVTFTSRTVTTT